jgi:hypothetical protein
VQILPTALTTKISIMHVSMHGNGGLGGTGTGTGIILKIKFS